jgi:hypothetical protein
MTPKQTALRNTLAVFASGIVGGLLMAVIVVNFTLAQISIGFGILFVLCISKLVYDLELSKAEHLKTLNELNTPKG